MNFIEKETMEHDRDADETELPLFLQGEVSPLLKSGVKLPSYIKDHRKRLRQRFMQGGATAIPDYELLELVFGQLTHLMAQKDYGQTRLLEMVLYLKILINNYHYLP